MKSKQTNRAAVIANTPACPPHLDQEAAAEWDRIVPELCERGLLHGVDRSALSGYCACWSRWVKAEQKLAETGLVVKSPVGFAVVSPYFLIASRTLDQLGRFLREFGMSPAARKRIDKQLAPAQDKPKANARRGPLSGLKVIG